MEVFLATTKTLFQRQQYSPPLLLFQTKIELRQMQAIIGKEDPLLSQTYDISTLSPLNT